VPQVVVPWLQKGSDAMSYLVLARKWRPQGFDDLIGQEPIARILKNSISQNKIAHAYIFSGPRGVGKTSTARIFAKALNCEKGPTEIPCGTCTSCMSITDGSSVDVLEIDGASNNSVDDIRDLREGVKYMPLGGRYKIYIIDESHMLSVSAFNALLKTLEEPPPHAIFVLATTAPKKIPATIFSRCQHLPFRRISTQRIKERLKHIVSSEGIRINDSALEMVARAADGSMRDSLTILDQVTSFSSDITESEVKDLLGIADIGMLSDMAIALIDGDREKILNVIAELVDRGTDLKSFVKDLVGFFRDMLVAKVVKKPEDVLDLAENEINVFRTILPKVSSDLLTLLLSEIIKSESDVRSSFSPRISLEMSLLRISFMSSLTPVEKAIENIEAILKGIAVEDAMDKGLYVEKSEDSSPEKMQDTGSTIHDEGMIQDTGSTIHDKKHASCIMHRESWGVHHESCSMNHVSDMDGKSLLDAIIEKIDDPRITSRLAKATPVIKDNTLTLIFNSNEAELFAEPIRKNSSAIEKMVSDVRKAPTRLNIEIKLKKVVHKKDIKDKILTDPAIKEAIDLFDARVIDVKIKENTGGG
jgi:DNA polymerase-3 subunit gamma/tau